MIIKIIKVGIWELVCDWSFYELLYFFDLDLVVLNDELFFIVDCVLYIFMEWDGRNGNNVKN